MFLPQLIFPSCVKTSDFFRTVLRSAHCLAWNGFSYSLFMPLLPLPSAWVKCTPLVQISLSPSGGVRHSGLCLLWVTTLCLVHCTCISPPAPPLLASTLTCSTKLCVAWTGSVSYLFFNFQNLVQFFTILGDQRCLVNELTMTFKQLTNDRIKEKSHYSHLSYQTPFNY